MNTFDFWGRRIDVVAERETADWLRREVKPNIAATFTLRQSRSEYQGRVRHWIRGDEIEYRRTYETLVRDLSCRYLGKAFRRYRKLVPHFASLEGDGEAKRFHIHAAFRCPGHVRIEDFMSSIRFRWSMSPWRMGDNKIELITADWTGYTLKEGSEALLSAGGF
jgi:hypothetical protein